MQTTNMSCLTPEGATSGDCDFLSANMYARSLFGEDALANLSVERTEQGVTGHVRIRAKTQGIALSLGDRITMGKLCILLPLVNSLTSSSSKGDQVIGGMTGVWETVEDWCNDQDCIIRNFRHPGCVFLSTWACALRRLSMWV